MKGPRNLARLGPYLQGATAAKQDDAQFQGCDNARVCFCCWFVDCYRVWGIAPKLAAGEAGFGEILATEKDSKALASMDYIQD